MSTESKEPCNHIIAAWKGIDEGGIMRASDDQKMLTMVTIEEWFRF